MYQPIVNAEDFEGTAKVARLLVELGALKLTPRSGWFKIGIKLPESVAEHSFRAAVIAYVLARMDGIDPLKASAVAFLALLHDSHEARTLDLHKVARKYVTVNEEEARREQLEPLGLDELRERLRVENVDDYIKDADRLELMIQAKEYSQLTDLTEEFRVKEEEMKTKAGKLLFRALESVDLRWWKF